MSEVKVNKISPRTNCGTVQLGDSGDTITIPAGATITNNGTQTGFGRTGTVDWQTSIKTSATFSASNGEGYFVDTSSNAITANLPAGTAGAIVAFKDYAQTFDTNGLTISANGSDKIEGQTFDLLLNTEGLAVTLVFGDSTKGWQAVNSNEVTNSQKFVNATGGTITTVCTNFKVHTFTGPGTFCVTCAGNSSGSNTVDYLVVAGGGAGGRGASDSGNAGGGGGGGGYRESGGTASGCYTVSPLGSSPSSVAALPVSVQSYPIQVGGGGTTAPFPAPSGTAAPAPAAAGAISVFSTITSAGGGGGASRSNPTPQGGGPGGSGGGAVSTNPVGSGNQPPVSPPQGQDGGNTPVSRANSAGGGGGATTAGGGNPGSADQGGPGGTGATSSINGTPTTRAGGGGGGGSTNNGSSPGPGAGGSGGSGGGGSGANDDTSNAAAGTTNTGGGGGGGAGSDPGTAGANGGSGIVIIRYKFQ